jgi:hypothetical protein
MKRIKLQALFFFTLGSLFLAFSIVEKQILYGVVSAVNFLIFGFLYVHYANEKLIRGENKFPDDAVKNPGKSRAKQQ